MFTTTINTWYLVPFVPHAYVAIIYKREEYYRSHLQAKTARDGERGRPNTHDLMIHHHRATIVLYLLGYDTTSRRRPTEVNIMVAEQEVKWSDTWYISGSSSCSFSSSSSSSSSINNSIYSINSTVVLMVVVVVVVVVVVAAAAAVVVAAVAAVVYA